MDVRDLCIRLINISRPKATIFKMTKGSIPASQQVPVMGIIYPSPNALCTFKKGSLSRLKRECGISRVYF